ncbi:MAG TPA: hypothetical protein VHC21_00050 [Candidatus Saccharimonadales bacterium]|nr:hypothetical protein [Candidatus Saccharimonadales bacterium]
MNPSSGETPNLNLPPPVDQAGEQAPLPAGADSQPEMAPGRAAAPERASAPPAAAAPVFQVPVPAPATPAAPVSQATDDVTSTSKSKSSKLIKDDDLIEKEWVDKAKRIVERTRDDPHQQSEQLTMVKADYMKQHYDKTIKVNK